MKNGNKKLKLVIIIIALIGVVILNPLGDAIRDNGNKRLQKSIEILRDFLFFVLIGVYSANLTLFILLGLSHLSLRIAFHNVTYNLTRKPKLPWYYVGTTSKSDDIEKMINKKVVLISRISSFGFSILLFWLAFK